MASDRLFKRAVPRSTLALLLATGLVLSLGVGQAIPADDPDIPPDVDPGTPEYTGPDDPVPDEPIDFDPTTGMLEAIFDADVSDGGESFWIDRILERPAGLAGGNNLYTRGRALFMASHAAGTLGFAGSGNTANQGAGGWAYREPQGPGVHHLYTIGVSGPGLSEVTAQRSQYPSHWSSVHAGGELSVEQRKFITHNNVAVTVLDITNTSDEPTQRTLTVTAPSATTPDGDELTGTVTIRYGVTTVELRVSGEEFTVSPANTLTRAVALDPGESVTVKVQAGAIADEIPESATEYERFRDLEPEEAFLTQLAEYNEWWVENVPYVDVPDQNIKKMSYYRTFLSRFNYVDADIPGNDYQFPVSLEGVLGYNNAIQLTQPMHLQDLKYFRDPLYSYGNWVSSGETSKCHAFIDNPGSHSWGNTYEQYIAREAWNAYKVHGGDRGIVENLAHYAECDVKGQLDKYDTQGNFLIEYPHGFLTGNDFDATPFVYAHPSQGNAANRQDRAESAFWWAGAKAAAEAYDLLGEDAKAAEMAELADNMAEAILDLLWDDGPIDVDPDPTPTPATRSPSQDGFGTAIRLGSPEPNQYVEMPAGILGEVEDFTIASWVNWDGGQTWTRIFDFGTGTAVNMFLTPNAGGADNGLRFAITTSGGGGEQQVTSSQQLPTGWQHVAVTKEGTTVTIWLNGDELVSGDNVTLSPSDLGNTTQNWIGNSQYPDPLLTGLIDEFNIFDRALTEEEIEALVESPGGGDLGGGNVAWYAFDEEEDLGTAVDSSGNDNHATVITPVDVERPGHVFKHRLVNTGELIPWKDQQNFAPFMEGVVPTDDPAFREALRYYADAAEFPIMPFYTANQADKAEAAAIGRGGSNNFSNINSTLQAQVFSSALRNYPSPYITNGMYRALLEWLTWVQYVNGDNQFPNNNEFFFNWNPTNQTLGRSGIHHNILGAYNFMIIDDIAGVRPRVDEIVELWPIDVGWEYFAVDNLRYHGKDMTVVWNQPGSPHYSGVPEGYSLYLDGQRVLTVDRLAHLTWDPRRGRVAVLDDSGAQVLFRAPGDLAEATGVSLVDNDRIVDVFLKAGRDLTPETGWAVNHAEGKPVEASFTTTSPSLRATAPEHAVSGFTVSGLPSVGTGNNFGRPGFQATNTIWGTQGSPNDEDWLAIDLGQPRQLDTVNLYFFNDKSYNPQQSCPGNCTNTYREPASYTLQYHDGTDWVDVPDQAATPETPLPNLNQVTFPQITAQQVRLVVTPQTGFGVGVKEIQVFNTTPVSFAEVRQLVDDLHDTGEITEAAWARLRAHLDQAETLLTGPGSPQSQRAGIQALEQFVEVASDPRTGEEAARHALIDAGEQLIAQHSPPGFGR